MAFGLSAVLDYAVSVESDHDCWVHLLQASRLEAAQMATRVGLPLKSSRNGTFSQGQDGGGLHEETHTL